MIPRGISVKKLNNFLEDLRKQGLWAERHSYSIRIMYNGKFVASLHLYPGFNEAVLRLYGDVEVNNMVQEVVYKTVSRYLPDFKLKIQVISL